MSSSSLGWVLQSNRSSCLDESKYEYVTECYISLIVTFACFGVGLVGIILNSQILLCYGWFRRLSLGSDKLAFIYGVVDMISCIATVTTFFAILKTYTMFSCFSYMIMFMLMTRTTVYLFVFMSVNRYYSVCLRDDEIHFFSHQKPRLILFTLLVSSVFETGLHCYTGCIEFEAPRVLFLQQIGQQFHSVSLRISYGLTVINYVVLVLASLITPILYWKISQNEKQNQTFAFGDPKYDEYYQKRVTKMSRWTTILSIAFLLPRAIVQLFLFKYGLTEFCGVYLSQTLIECLTFITDLVNLMMFVLTPLLHLRHYCFWPSKFFFFKNVIQLTQIRKYLLKNLNLTQGWAKIPTK